MAQPAPRKHQNQDFSVRFYPLVSQGGQRVLLRLELQADTEIERTFLLGDPLRSAFQADTDPDLRDLNLSVSIRAYADQLILEAARQHLAQSNLGHQVQLLTSDQGLARMALAEGIVPLFFSAVAAGDLFGKRFTGATLDPFNGQLCETPIASLLWELATAFGSVKLETEDKAHNLVIAAIGEGLSWSPYQSHADLLWCDYGSVPEWREAARTETPKAAVVDAELKVDRTGQTPRTRQIGSKSAAKNARPTGAATVSLPRFSVDQLFILVDALDNNQILSEDRALALVGARSRKSVDEYRRFLQLAGLITIEAREWTATPDTQRLAIALRNEDIAGVRELLLRSPSFALFAQRLTQMGTGQVWDPTEFKRSATTFKTLGEVCCLCASVAGEGLYATPNTPHPTEFAPIALQRFKDLDQGDGLVATGAWLEELIRKDGIHPEIARLRLNDASALNLLRRSTEGSTTEVRFDNHTIQVLRVRSGRPTVAVVHLYRGDYLIPGKSSTSLRIEGPSA